MSNEESTSFPESSKTDPDKSFSVRTRLETVLTHRLFPYALGLLASLLLVTALGAGWQMDDHFQRTMLLGLGGRHPINLSVHFNGDPKVNRYLMDMGILPWWSAENLRHGNLRYLSVLTMMLDYLFWPENPALMHFHSLLWLSGLVIAAAFLYRRLMGAVWAAGLAGLFFALDEAHAIPATYLANRYALIATFFGILCLFVFDRWRRGGWRWGGAFSPVFLALALAAGEIALSTVGYLAAYALFLDEGSILQRMKRLLPNGAVLIVWALVYISGPFGAENSGYYLDPLGNPLSFVWTFLERAPYLLMGQWTPVPAEIFHLSLPGAYIATLVVLVLLAFLLAPVVKRVRVARFWCLGAVLSLVPVCAGAPENRLLVFVGLGCMGLLAQLVQELLSGSLELPNRPWWRLPARAMTGLLLIFHLVFAPPLAHAFNFYSIQNVVLKRAISSVPEDDRIAEQDLILLNPPDYTYLVTAIPTIKITKAVPYSPRMRALAAGTSAMEIFRVDATTLDVKIAAGLFPTPWSRYYRSKELGFSVGQRVSLSDFSVEIRALNETGDPSELRYRFAVPLEDSSLRWLVWKDGVYELWPLPSPGKSVALPASKGLFSI